MRFVGAVRFRAARWCGGGGLDCGGCAALAPSAAMVAAAAAERAAGGLAAAAAALPRAAAAAEGGGDDGESATGVVKGGGGRATLRFSHVALMIAVRLARLGRIGGGVRKRARVVKLDRVADALCSFDQRIPPMTDAEITTTKSAQTTHAQQVRTPPKHSNRSGIRTSSVDDAGDPPPFWLSRWYEPFCAPNMGRTAERRLVVRARVSQPARGTPVVPLCRRHGEC